jgi:hypothetical protein
MTAISGDANDTTRSALNCGDQRGGGGVERAPLDSASAFFVWWSGAKLVDDGFEL